MREAKKVCGMTLQPIDRFGVDAFQGEHPFGSSVSFYPYLGKDASGKKTEKWIWSYEGADSSGHNSLLEAVHNWKSVFNLW